MAESTLTAESGSRTERRRARNHDALVEAARRLFVQDGFEATTISAITAEADLGFGTFYRYFADKEAALDAVLAQASAEMDAIIDAPAGSDVPAVRSLTRFLEHFVQVGLRNRGVFHLWLQVSLRSEGRASREAAARGRVGFPVRVHQAVTRLVEHGVSRGEFATTDVHLASSFIVGGLMYTLGPTERDEADLTASLVALALRTLGVQEAPAGRRNGGEGS